MNLSSHTVAKAFVLRKTNTLKTNNTFTFSPQKWLIYSVPLGSCNDPLLESPENSLHFALAHNQANLFGNAKGNSGLGKARKREKKKQGKILSGIKTPPECFPMKSVYVLSKWLNSESPSAAPLPRFQTSAHTPPAGICNLNIQHENKVPELLAQESAPYHTHTHTHTDCLLHISVQHECFGFGRDTVCCGVGS